MRTGFWDLETTNLKASFGQILCGAVGLYLPDKPLEPSLREFRLHDYSTPRGRCDDSGLAKDIAEYLSTFDLLIGYNSVRFDTTFLNTRLAKYGFPGATIHRHKDLLYTMRYHFSLQSNSLANVAKFFFGSTLKTELSWDNWRLAHAGDECAYEDVVEHCRYDVLELARVWQRVSAIAGVLK